MEEYYVKTLPTENFLVRVYGWMATALTLTAVTAYIVASTPSIYQTIIQNPVIFFGLIFGQLALVMALSAGLQRLSYSAALTMFLAYSAAVGVTFAPLFEVYTDASLALAFMVTAFMFATMALYGYFTRADLSSMGGILRMLLIGLFISMVINLFLGSSTMDFIISGVGVILFCCLVAFDMQYLKKLAASAFEDMQEFNKLTLIGALTLYLNLLNLFLFVLRFLGKPRED